MYEKGDMAGPITLARVRISAPPFCGCLGSETRCSTQEVPKYAFPEVSANAEQSDTSADTADADAETLSPEAQRKAKIAAAVARAKAKKAARENSEDQEQDNA